MHSQSYLVVWGFLVDHKNFASDMQQRVKKTKLNFVKSHEGSSKVVFMYFFLTLLFLSFFFKRMKQMIYFIRK